MSISVSDCWCLWEIPLIYRTAYVSLLLPSILSLCPDLNSLYDCLSPKTDPGYTVWLYDIAYFKCLVCLWGGLNVFLFLNLSSSPISDYIVWLLWYRCILTNLGTFYKSGGPMLGIDKPELRFDSYMIGLCIALTVLGGEILYML